MEVAFNVRNAGPLSQISVHLFSLANAVQVAVGAYGWWRARERVQSLVTTVEAAGASLVSTSSFNLRSYEERCAEVKIRGVCVERGTVVRATLPKASTANTGDAGQKCLRALTIELLCFFNQEAVTKILAEVVPTALLNLDQQGQSFVFEGPLWTSLADYVKAVEREEDNSSLRQDLLDHLGQFFQATGTETGLAGVDWTFGSDYAKVRGLIKWALQPLMRRLPQYQTRSLLAWSLAIVLSQLCFDVLPSPILIARKDQVQGDAERQAQQGYNVFLVTGSDMKTDPMEPEVLAWDLKLNPSSPFNTLKPRILSMRAIPWFAFRESPAIKEQQIHTLADMWDFTFATVTTSLQGPKSHDLRRVWHMPGQEVADHRVTNMFHKQLLNVFSPDLADILRKPMSTYVKVKPEHQHLVGEIEQYAKRLRANAWEPPPPMIAELWNTMACIILASLYAMISLVLFDNGQDAGAHTEVAFHPHTAYSSRIERWAGGLADCLVRESGLGASTWHATLYEMLTGTPAANYGDDHPTTQPYNATMAPSRWDVYGCQRNGIMVVNELLVHPSPSHHTRIFHHVSTGQILTLPVDEHGYLRSAPARVYGGWKELTLADKMESLGRPTPEAPRDDSTIRVDVEPAWETDPTKVVLIVRRGGRRFAEMEPIRFDTKLGGSFETVRCSCHRFSLSVKVPQEETWQYWSFSDLMRLGNRLRPLRGTHVMVDVGEDESAQLFATYIMDSDFTLVAKDCMACTYKRLRAVRDDPSNFLKGSHNSFLILNGMPWHRGGTQ